MGTAGPYGVTAIRSAGCRTSCQRAMTDRSVARTVGQSSCGSGHHPPAPTSVTERPRRQRNDAHSQVDGQKARPSRERTSRASRGCEEQVSALDESPVDTPFADLGGDLIGPSREPTSKAMGCRGSMDAVQRHSMPKRSMAPPACTELLVGSVRTLRAGLHYQ